MPTNEEILKAYQHEIEESKRSLAICEGEEKQLLTRLHEEFGLQNKEELEVEMEETQKQVDLLQKEFDSLMSEIQEKYPLEEKK